MTDKKPYTPFPAVPPYSYGFSINSTPGSYNYACPGFTPDGSIYNVNTTVTEHNIPKMEEKILNLAKTVEGLLQNVTDFSLSASKKDERIETLAMDHGHFAYTMGLLMGEIDNMKVDKDMDKIDHLFTESEKTTGVFLKMSERVDRIEAWMQLFQETRLKDLERKVEILMDSVYRVSAHIAEMKLETSL